MRNVMQTKWKSTENKPNQSRKKEVFSKTLANKPKPNRNYWIRYERKKEKYKSKRKMRNKFIRIFSNYMEQILFLLLSICTQQLTQRERDRHTQKLSALDGFDGFVKINSRRRTFYQNPWRINCTMYNSQTETRRNRTRMRKQSYKQIEIGVGIVQFTVLVSIFFLLFLWFIFPRKGKMRSAYRLAFFPISIPFYELSLFFSYFIRMWVWLWYNALLRLFRLFKRLNRDNNKAE